MVACRSVFFTLVLLLLITYVFSVAFMTFSKNTPLETGVFRSMGSATLALVMKGIFPDQEALGASREPLKTFKNKIDKTRVYIGFKWF